MLREGFTRLMAMYQNHFHGILVNHAKPSCIELFPDDNYLFQQDNDPKHTAKRNKAYVEKYMLTLDWRRSQSSELNPIENIWSILNEKTKKRVYNDEACLFNCVQEAWNNIEPLLLTC